MPSTSATNSPKIPLTIIILAHRPDELLENAVASAHFADQILLIDLGNSITDKKLEKKYQIDRIAFPELSGAILDFSQVRNRSLLHARHEWIFFLDSDEVIEPSSIPAIKNIIAESPENAAFVRRQDVFYGKKLKWGEVGNHWLLRMGRKGSLKFFRPVHEVAETDGAIARTGILLTHYAHNSITEFIAKVTFYAKIDAYYRFERQQPFSIFEMIFWPLGKFITNYFGKLGFLDGWRGLVYATIMSLHSFFVRVYLYQFEQVDRQKTTPDYETV